MHEGIDSSIFNSQVLIHAKSMKQLGINIDILSFNTNKKTKILSSLNKNKLELSNPDVNIELRNGFNIYFPFATFINSYLLMFFLKNTKKNYEIIHSRSDYSTFITCMTKFFHQKKIIWDCRGDSLNELEDTLSTKNSLIKFLGYFFLIPFNKFQIFLNSKFSNAVIFVSESLYKLHSKNLVTTNHQIIPCPVSENLFYFEPNLRLQQRKDKHFNESDQIFLYSGSLASYQSFDLQLSFYRKILKNPNNIIIFATTEIELATKLFLDIFPDRFLIVNIPFFEMNTYYNLADFAVLLRDKKPLNFVASPTKFGEYCLSGLPVIMNDTVNQSIEYSKMIGNYINWLEPNFIKIDNDKRAIISKKSIRYFSRDELNKQYLTIYNYFN